MLRMFSKRSQRLDRSSKHSVATENASTSSSETIPEKKLSEDEQLIMDAEKLKADDCLLHATDLLRQVKDKTLLKPEHEEILRNGEIVGKTREEMMAPPDQPGWKKHGEAHGDGADFSIYYKITDKGVCQIRIDAPVDASLFVPFYAVFNEPELQKTWIPSWSFPFKVGISKTVKLAQKGRVNQMVQMQNDFGPLNKRETILWVLGDDDTARSRCVMMKLTGLQTSEQDDAVPPMEKKVVRMDLDGGLLFRPCPHDHPILAKSKKQHPPDEKLILLTYTMAIDPMVTFVPKPLLNFCTRTVVGGIWRKMLQVAEEARDGKRPEFTEVMEAKKDEVYDWMAERAKVVLSQAESDKDTDTSSVTFERKRTPSPEP